MVVSPSYRLFGLMDMSIEPYGLDPDDAHWLLTVPGLTFPKCHRQSFSRRCAWIAGPVNLRKILPIGSAGKKWKWNFPPESSEFTPSMAGFRMSL